MTDALSLESVSFGYDQTTLLQDISLQVKQGEVACLLGPSGCGKSTILRLIAGFEKPRAGRVLVNGQTVADTTAFVPPQKREVGMLFQDLALFPHLSVSQNIAYGLNQPDPGRLQELLSLCRIELLKDRYPHQLSGGQKQRVALARAMAPKPDLILLDEPFSSVDQGLQIELVHEIKDMLRNDDSTVLWVTHSLTEACAVADKMGLILDGELMQWSTPHEFYHFPQHEDVVRFLNHGCLISGTVNDSGHIATAIGRFKLINFDELAVGRATKVCVVKKQVLINPSATPNARVLDCIYQGSHYALTVELDSQEVVKAVVDERYEPGQALHVGSTEDALMGIQQG